jgi:CheY-like chemotaxis protein
LLTGRKLLLADDSLTIQKVVSLTFNDEAMEVTTVGSGAEALKSLQESLPDIVLADVLMPEPDGYELCERIKSDERTRRIPVVLLVGTFEPFNEAEARRVGADEVLTKPFQSIRDLVNKVGGLLGGSDEKNSNAESARDERNAAETTQDLSPFAADARAANPNTETGAETVTPVADAFNDFDMDDATIQSTPAAAFDARAAHATSALEINEEEQFSDRGETDEAFVLDDDNAPVQAHAAAASSSAGSSFAAFSNAAAEAAPVAAVEADDFKSHAARAAEADDALLELGDIAPAEGNAAVEADDFILDIGDEDSFDPVAAAPTTAYAPPTEYSAPAEHAAQAEAEHAASVAEIDMHFAENAPLTEAPEAFAGLETSESHGMVAESEHALLAPETEEVAEEMPLPQEDETVAETYEFMSEHAYAETESAPFFESGASMGSAAPSAETVTHFESEAAPVEAESASHSSPADAAVESSPAVAVAAPEQSQASSASLSPEMLDEVVRRVVAHMSEQVVREIAWEVVPDLAERLIKQRLEEEKTRTTP